MTLIYDWETTGKANFDFPSSHFSQPKPVQLGAILFDAFREERAVLNLLIKPEGWTISKEVSEVHGITQEHANRYGFPLASVMRAFDYLLDRADRLVSFNLEFDNLVTAKAKHVLKPEPDAVEWGTEKGFCIMKAMTPICRLPKPHWQQARYGDEFKWPNLQEAHRHCFGKGFDGSHDALEDVRATARIYFWYLDQLQPPKANHNETTAERNTTSDATKVT